MFVNYYIECVYVKRERHTGKFIIVIYIIMNKQAKETSVQKNIYEQKKKSLSIGSRIYQWFSKLSASTTEGIDMRRSLLTLGILSSVVLFSSITVLRIILSPGSADYNIQKYFFLYTLPVLLLFGLILNLGPNESETKLFGKIAGLIILLVVATYYYVTSTDSLFNAALLSNYSFLALITIVGLAIVYQSLVDYMERLKGWPGFIAQLIFYIPCVILDVWEYVIEQFQLTPYSIYLFILFEILLIILYVYLPEISNKVTGLDDSIQAVDNVMVLDGGKTVVVNSDELKIVKTGDEQSASLEGEYRTNYAISMWVYITPQAPNDPAYNKESEIFSYGYEDNEGVQHVKPMIRYYGGGGGDDQVIERNKFVFYFSRYPPVNQYNSDEHTFYDVTLPNQKWNQIVLNYNRNIVDIFINGVLERSFTMTKDMPRYNNLDTITVGDDVGIKGGICNVVYYKHPLTKEQVAISYNAKMNANPPVASIPDKNST